MAEERQIKIISQEKGMVELEFVTEDVAFLHALREYLIKDKNVELSAVKKDHPEIGNPQIYIKGTKPIDSLKKALTAMKKDSEGLLSKLK